MNEGKPRVIFILGPTASGKTDLAMGLSEQMPIDLISVDSAQVYRGMNIGSAKPDAETLEQFPHQLIDIRDPSEPYSAAEFRADALECINKAHQSERIPCLVGGTMLYFKALIDGLADMPPTDLNFRQEIEARAERLGWPALHKELEQIDPVTAAKLHPNHSARIERALQVFNATGVPLSAYHVHQQAEDFSKRFDLFQLAILPQKRSVLHDRIEKRIESMFLAGFLDEVKGLYDRGDLNDELPSIRAVGYRQVWSHLDGSINFEEAKEKMLFATRKLAKRQLTWMRNWEALNLLYTQDSGGATLPTESLVKRCAKLFEERFAGRL